MGQNYKVNMDFVCDQKNGGGQILFSIETSVDNVL